MVDCTSEDLSRSPVFPSRQLTAQQSAVSTSESVTKVQDTNCSTNNSSPWLSKERGISNGKTSVKTQSGYGIIAVSLICADYACCHNE